MSGCEQGRTVAETHWALMAEIETLEELLADARLHAEADDGLAALGGLLGEALGRRQRALRGNRRAVADARDSGPQRVVGGRGAGD